MPQERNKPPQRQSDLAFHIVVGIIVVMAAIFVAGLLLSLLHQ